MTGSTFAANAFTAALSPFVGIFREQFLRLLMGAHLLLGIGLVEILLMRRVQVVDQALMLVIELGWKVDLDLL
jgi:hypothetical protein